MRPLISLLTIAVLLQGCSSKKKETPTDLKSGASTSVVLTAEQIKAADIRLGRIQQKSVSGLVKTNGVLDVPPQNLVTISAPLGGFVKNTELLQGMKVKRGQVVAVLEHPDYIQLQEDYLSTKSQLEYLH